MKIRHRIYVRHIKGLVQERLSIPLIKHCIRTTLNHEGVDRNCEVSVLVTDDRGIRKINAEYRKIDAATDVLSFPMSEFIAPGWDPDGIFDTDPDTGVVPLGDIVISAGKVRIQASENDQTCERETAYLIIHSTLHLLGYDHTDEAEGKRQMRKREEEILEKLLGVL